MTDFRALQAAYTKHWEGCRLKAYPDAGGYSIGYGHHSAGITATTVWTQAQADQVFVDDSASAAIEAGNTLTFTAWNEIGAARQAVLTDMAYELGFGGLRAFAKMRQALELGQWDNAAAEVLDSAAAKEVPDRWKMHAQILRQGDAAIVNGALPT